MAVRRKHVRIYEILELLYEAGPLTFDEIVDYTCGTEGAIRDGIPRLLKNGMIFEEPKGTYHHYSERLVKREAI